MSNRLSPANLVARSVASARSLATSVPPPPPRLLPFLQRGGGTMSAVRPAPLTLLAALTALAVAAALFAIYVYPAYAQEGSAPDKPTGLEAAASHGQVVLTWDDPGDDSITGYVILRRVRVNDQGGDFNVLVANTETAATTYTDTTVAASLTYTYRIKAINEHGTSERSRWYHIDTPAAAPVANSPATGSPPITGTAQVGETLTVDTSGIADEDGLENAAFSYQWLADATAISGATAGTYTPVEADEGKAITVQVNFTDDADNDETLTSAPTDAVATAQPTDPPAKPTDLSATATHNQVVLTWKDPNDNSITGYVILRRVRVNDTGGDFSVLVADTGTAATTYTDDEVAASTTYTYRIKAINEHGTSERSSWSHIDTPAAPEPETDPDDLAPSSLAAALADGQVMLSWDAPAEDAGSVTGYEILRGEGTDEPATLAADTGSATTTYTDATANTASESYAYSVKAIRVGVRSQASNKAAVQLPPGVPTGVNSAAAHDRVLLSWTDPQDDAITGYRILRADVVDGASGEFAAIADDTGNTETGYTDTTVEAEQSYVYRVQAIGPGGLSGPSMDLAVNTPPAPVAVVVTPADPQAPSNLAAELADGQVVLNWDAPAEEAAAVTGYEILRAEGQGELDTLASDTGNADTTYTDATVASDGTSYAYRVKAIRDGERGGTSNEARVLLKPAKPRTLTAPVIAHNSVTLTWRDPQDDSITGYVILRRDKAIHEEGIFQDVEDDTGSADTTYTDDTAEPNRQYVYRIKAINAAGLSEISSWVRAYTPAAPDGQPPAAPQQVLNGAGHDRVLLFWLDPQDDSITGYRILRADVLDGAPGEFAVLIQDTGTAAATYTDDTVEPETSYVYRVLAINPGGASEPSHDVEVRTTAPVAPQEPLRTEPANVSEDGADCPATTATTCEVDVGGSVTGNIESDLDSDHFKVELEAGTRYQMDLEGVPTGRGTLPDPLLGIRPAADGTEANDDDGGVGLNSRVIYTPAAGGTYFVQVRDTTTNTPGTYTLSVIVLGTNGNSEADTDFPTTTSTTGRVAVGASATGNVNATGDGDWFRVDLETGKTYQFDLEGADTTRGTLSDPTLSLYDGSGNPITNDDDSGTNLNSLLTYTATATSAHYLGARGSVTRTGTYTLSVREVTPPVDPNRPQATLHLSTYYPLEDHARITVTATVSPASPTPFTVEVSATPASPDGDFGEFHGPAQEDDFSLSSNRTLRFAANATASTGTVTISTIADDATEPDELVTVSGTVSSEGITDPDDITLTIVNDDPEPLDIWVSVPATVNEDAGTATVTYKLRTRGVNQPPVIGAEHVYYIPERRETAARDDDYTPPPGRASGQDVIFDTVPASAFSPSATRAVWEAEGTFTIGIVDDTEEEGNETIVFRVRPGGSSNYRSIKRTIIILDDDTTPTVTIRAVNRDTIEGVPARFRLTRTGSRQDSLNVKVTVTEEEGRDVLPSYEETDHFIPIRRGEATRTFELDVRDNISGSRDGDITAEIQEPPGGLSPYTIGSPSSATVTVEHSTHSHPEFSHSHSLYRGGFYDHIYPDHSHGSHTHGDTSNRHSSALLIAGHPWTELLEGVEAGEHVHHEEGGYVDQGPNRRRHDGIYHVHECRSITRACHHAADWESGRYGGTLPREIYHRHDNAEPGHGYSWPDLRANGNSPAEGHVYIGGVWIVQVGDTITADTWRVSDPDGMSNARLRYQWLADYGEIRGATGSSYTATRDVVGKKIRVMVTFTDDAGTEEVLRSRATLKVKPAETDDE